MLEVNYSVQVDSARISRHGRVIEIDLPQNPVTVRSRGRIKPRQNVLFFRKAMKDLGKYGEAIIADPDNPFWLSSGGGTYVTQDKRIITITRTDAPVYPNKESIFLGRSNSLEEALDVNKVRIRELSEECLIVNNDSKLVILDSDIAESTAYESASNIGLKHICGIKRIDPNPIESPNSDTLVINQEGHQQRRFKGLCYWDPRIPMPGIDLIGLYALPYWFDDFQLYDGENFNRNIASVNPYKMNPAKTTPTLEYLLRRLKSNSVEDCYPIPSELSSYYLR